MERRLEHDRAARGVGITSGVDGSALEQHAGGDEDVLRPRLPSALTAPTFGSCWYMIRHVTPVANAEIAIGRKTTVLNATDQRTRSVSTAKIRPIAVTNAGTTATQIALFLIAVSSVERREEPLVVVEADPGAEVALLAEEAADDRVDGRIDDPDGRARTAAGARKNAPVT